LIKPFLLLSSHTHVMTEVLHCYRIYLYKGAKLEAIKEYKCVEDFHQQSATLKIVYDFCEIFMVTKRVENRQSTTASYKIAMESRVQGWGLGKI